MQINNLAKKYNSFPFVLFHELQSLIDVGSSGNALECGFLIFASAQKTQLSHWGPLSAAVSGVSLESLLSSDKRVQSVHRVHIATALLIAAMPPIKKYSRSCEATRHKW